MSPRTLTARPETDGTPEIRPKYTPEQYQPDVEQHLWGIVSELFQLGRRHREIAPMVQKLDAWLTKAQAWQVAHPNAPDVDERWALYAERNERYQALLAELEGIESRAMQVRKSLATHWDRLKPKRQAALRQEPGWSQAQSGNRIAGEMWRSACEGGIWPGGECPFALIGVLVMLGGLIYG
jgi:hypothetical protein